eukprot:9368570-Heterocapsa_arctica.AAC.1
MRTDLGLASLVASFLLLKPLDSELGWKLSDVCVIRLPGRGERIGDREAALPLLPQDAGERLNSSEPLRCKSRGVAKPFRAPAPAVCAASGAEAPCGLGGSGNPPSAGTGVPGAAIEPIG